MCLTCVQSSLVYLVLLLPLPCVSTSVVVLSNLFATCSVPVQSFPVCDVCDFCSCLFLLSSVLWCLSCLVPLVLYSPMIFVIFTSRDCFVFHLFKLLFSAFGSCSFERNTLIEFCVAQIVWAFTNLLRVCVCAFVLQRQFSSGRVKICTDPTWLWLRVIRFRSGGNSQVELISLQARSVKPYLSRARVSSRQCSGCSAGHDPTLWSPHRPLGGPRPGSRRTPWYGWTWGWRSSSPRASSAGFSCSCQVVQCWHRRTKARLILLGRQRIKF